MLVSNMIRSVLILGLSFFCALLTAPCQVSAENECEVVPVGENHCPELLPAAFLQGSRLHLYNEASVSFAGSASLDLIPPEIIGVNPSEGSRVQESRPEIRVSYGDNESPIDAATVKIALDGTDVTALAEVSAQALLYIPETDLMPGEHTLVITLSDMNGNRIVPRISHFIIIQKQGTFLEAFMKPGTSTQHPDPSPQGGLWTADQRMPHTGGSLLDPGSYLRRFQHEKLSASLGILSLPGTDLISLPSYKPGVMMGTRVAGINAQAFALQSNPVESYRYGIRTMNSERKIMGGTIHGDVLGNEKLKLSLTHLGGLQKTTVDGIISPDEGYGNAESILMESKLIGDKLKFRAEYCESRFAAGVEDQSGDVRGNAWKTQLSGKGELFSWGFSSSRLGQAFMAPENPVSGDRIRHNFNTGIILSPYSLKFSLLQAKDLVERNAQKSLADIRTGTVSYSYSLPNLPSFLTSYSLSTTDPIQGDDPGLDWSSAIHSLTFGTSFVRPKWSVSPTYTLKRFRDTGNRYDNDSNTYVVKITGGIKPSENLSLAPMFSFTRVLPENSQAESHTFQSGLAGTLQLIPSRMNLDTSLSCLSSRAQDKSIDTTSVRAKGQLNWVLERYLRNEMKKTLSLKGQVITIRDRAGDTGEKEWDISAMVNIGLPMEFMDFGRARGLGYH